MAFLGHEHASACLWPLEMLFVVFRHFPILEQKEVYSLLIFKKNDKLASPVCPACPACKASPACLVCTASPAF